MGSSSLGSSCDQKIQLRSLCLVASTLLGHLGSPYFGGGGTAGGSGRVVCDVWCVCVCGAYFKGSFKFLYEDIFF